MRCPPRTTVVVAVLAFVLAPASALACEIDNATPYTFPDNSQANKSETVYVWFDCGVSCGNYFKIAPKKSVTRPGKAGYVQACIDGAPGQFQREDGRVYVAEHGEARVKFGIEGSVTQGQLVNMDAFVWDVYDGNNKYTGSDQHKNYLVDHDGAGTWCWLGAP